MLEILLLSLIQSLTEFLPISSSGHLILTQRLLHTNNGLLLDILLHFGTLMAVVFYFYQDIWTMTKDVFTKKMNCPLFWKLCIASAPALIIGFLLHAHIESLLHHAWIIATTLIVFGIVLWLVDKYAPRSKKLSQMTYSQALYIGLAQSIALIPGTSRSGITITCARCFGFNRTDSAKFSMLLSIPVIFLGALYTLWKARAMINTAGLPLSSVLLAVFSAGVFGWLVVCFLMNWVKRVSFALFAVYRIVLGLFIFYILWGY